MKNASNAVQGQATLDRLSLQQQRLTPILEETYQQQSTMSMKEFTIMLERADVQLSQPELDVLLKLYGNGDGALALGFFRAALQHDTNRLGRVRQQQALPMALSVAAPNPPYRPISRYSPPPPAAAPNTGVNLF
jgi:hypothetical protein